MNKGCDGEEVSCSGERASRGKGGNSRASRQKVADVVTATRPEWLCGVRGRVAGGEVRGWGRGVSYGLQVTVMM